MSSPDPIDSEAAPPGRQDALAYSGGSLDRAPVQRRDPAWVAAQRAAPSGRWLPVRGDGVAIVEATGAAARIPATQLETVQLDDAILLGVHGDTPIWTVDLREPLDIPGVTWLELRRVAAMLPPADAALLAYARGMVEWQRRARFCSICGAPTAPADAGIVRRCTNTATPHDTYPRTDAAVIMLVERPATPTRAAACLLAHSARLPAGMYSTLAGFVEPGESLEDAVRREVFEEAGVRIGAVRYFGSQPWPFPASLMIGFHAIAEGDALVIDGDELADARWFTAGEVAAFGDPLDPSAMLRLPRRDSLAHALVAAWLDRQRP